MRGYHKLPVYWINADQVRVCPHEVLAERSIRGTLRKRASTHENLRPTLRYGLCLLTNARGHAVARRDPLQQCSVESMNRMLDAGAQLFYEGGSPAVTLEAIIERSGSSTGSFYARFGDIRGFHDAMHERVLELVSAEIMPILAQAALEPDLKSAVRSAVAGELDVIARHRQPLYFFAVGNSHDPTWRDMGAQFTIGMNDLITQIILKFLPTFTGTLAKRRIDMAVRMLIAAALQQIMLNQEEISRVAISQKMVATEMADMVCVYLRTAATH